MNKFFGKKKQEKEPVNIQVEEVKHDKSDISDISQQIYDNINNDIESNHKARDLIFLIGKAIDEWAMIYNMQELPKDFIFEQALGIMNSFYRNLSGKNDNRKCN